NYDENDGQFDHVMPPTPEPGTPGEFIGGLPVGLGFRVPCVVISPWSRGGYVCSQTFDHTSTLRLLETRFGVEVPNLTRWRRSVTGDLTAAFDFAVPPRLDVRACRKRRRRCSRPSTTQWRCRDPCRLRCRRCRTRKRARGHISADRTVTRSDSGASVR